MSFRPFDVVLVPFPFADSEEEKLRPTVVISRPELLEEVGVLWGLMVTSTDRPMLRGDVAVTDLARAGLLFPSRVRTSKINALTSERVLKVVGRLSSDDAQAVSAATAAWLATPVRES